MLRALVDGAVRGRQEATRPVIEDDWTALVLERR
jgi:hypothetical protein